MKKMNRIMSAILASCFTAGMAIPAASNAMYPHESDSGAFDFLKDYTPLDSEYNEKILIKLSDGKNFEGLNDEDIEKSVIYADPDGKHVCPLVPFDMKGYLKEDFVVFDLADGVTEEQVNELIAETISDYYTIAPHDYNYGHKYRFSTNCKYFKEICNILKEADMVTSFVIPKGYSRTIPYSLDFSRPEYILTDEEYSKLEEYLTKNNIADSLDAVEDEESVFSFFNNQANTLTENIDIIFGIYQDTGLFPTFDIPDTISDVVETDYVDVLNAIDGDANEDGKTNIADAAFVMQAVGNKDKYKLSAQGEFNADSDGDGLTALDALTIQKKIAGIG